MAFGDRYSIGTATLDGDNPPSVELGPGIIFLFDDGTSDADPGAGKIRLNSAAASSATAAYIDNSDAEGVSISAWLDTFDDGGGSTDRGFLHIKSVVSPQTYRIYRVTGSVVDGTGYRKLTLSHIAGNGSFSADQSLIVYFVQKGVTGSASSSADVAFSGDISPSQITSDQDDYNPTGLSTSAVIRHDLDADRSINGLQGGADGRLMVHANISSAVLKKNAERASSTAAYRFAGQDLEIDPGMAGIDIYDSTSSRWRPLGYRMRPLHLEVQPDPFPALMRPTLWHNFNLCPWLDRHWAFARGSTGTRYNAKGLIESVASGVPRFNFDLATGKRRLLIEGSRTNLCLRSQEFDNASWTKTDASVTADAATAPDGTTTADKLTVSAAGGRVRQSVTISSGATVAGSCFVKKSGSANWAILSAVAGAETKNVWVNLTTGALGTVQSAGSVITTFSAARVESLPNGWSRIHFVAVTTGVTSFEMSVSAAQSDNTASANADELYTWGAQIEAGQWPSSYIPTTSASVTRSADTLSRTDPDGLINVNEGTLFVSAIAPYDDPTNTQARTIAVLDDNSNANIHRWLFTTAGNLQFQTVVSSASQASFSTITAPGTSAFRVASGYKTDDVAAIRDGGTINSDTSASMPTVSRFRLGSTASGAQPLYGEIESIGYWPRRLSDTDLTALVA